MEPQYKAGELVSVASRRVLGLVTKPNYWALDEYLGGEIEMVDVIVKGKKRQYPARYILKIK
jgi:hypothetical protein